MCLCVGFFFLFCLSVYKKCHYSVIVDFINFVVRGFQSNLKGVFTLFEDLLMISESIFYFV